MNLYFKPEWRVPALVGALSFSAGVGVGVLGLTAKQRRDSRKYREDEWHAGNPYPNQMTLDWDKLEGPAGHMHKLDLDSVVPPSGTTSKSDYVQWPEAKLEDMKGIVPQTEIRAEPISTYALEPKPAVEPVNTIEGVVKPARIKEGPYVISADEFHSSTTGFKQADLEYFAEDNVLCDEQRIPIYNFETIVGDLPFGEASGDSNLVYIRNEALKGEWEITRVETSYLAEVHGIQLEEDAEADEDELRHSNRLLKFRDY